jgi:ABC-type phosphate transport system substrate-binding protein
MRKIILIALMIPAFVFADMVFVVAKTSVVTPLSKKQLKEIYLKKQQYANDIKLIPINMPASAHSRNIFDKSVLKMDESEIAEYWNERHYSGVNPPMVQNSPEAVKAMVKKVPGAIGYIDEEMLDDGLKVIATFK